MAKPYVRGRSMDLLYVFLRYFFETEYLHFGYWDEGVALKFANLKKAQRRYVDEVFKLIPDDVESILDVGCGSGAMAAELLEAGYRVDCVCPPSLLSAEAKKKLATKATVFEQRFEELETDTRYDLILFSESFQFVELYSGFNQCKRYGQKYVLIADIFRRDMPQRGPIGGGHKYAEFKKVYALTKIDEIDITRFVAPGIDLEVDAMRNFLQPLLKVVDRIATQKNRFMYRIFRILNRRGIARARKRYLDNDRRSAAAFEKYKTYKIMLFKL